MSIPHIPGAAPPEEFRRHIDAFLLDLYQAEYSPQTLRAYGWHLYRMANFLKADLPTNVTRRDFESVGSTSAEYISAGNEKAGCRSGQKVFSIFGTGRHHYS